MLGLRCCLLSGVSGSSRARCVNLCQRAPRYLWGLLFRASGPLVRCVPSDFNRNLAVPHRPDPGVRTGTRNPWSRRSPWAGSWAATMDNHSPASGKEADDHAIHKFMKDVERRCERHTKIMLLVGEFMKDAINKMKKE